MFKGFGDIAGLIKNARDIQQKIEELKASLATIPVEGVSGGGLVRVQGRGDGTVLSVKLDPGTVQSGDVEMLEDLIQAAMASFQVNMTAARKEKVDELTGGLNLPPGLDFGL